MRLFDPVERALTEAAASRLPNIEQRNCFAGTLVLYRAAQQVAELGFAANAARLQARSLAAVCATMAGEQTAEWSALAVAISPPDERTLLITNEPHPVVGARGRSVRVAWERAQPAIVNAPARTQIADIRAVDVCWRLDTQQPDSSICYVYVEIPAVGAPGRLVPAVVRVQAASTSVIPL